MVERLATSIVPATVALLVALKLYGSGGGQRVVAVVLAVLAIVWLLVVALRVRAGS